MLTDSLDQHMKPNHCMTWATYHRTYLDPGGQQMPDTAPEAEEIEEAHSTDELAMLRELYNREGSMFVILYDSWIQLVPVLNI
jgi:hypothetical protein